MSTISNSECAARLGQHLRKGDDIDEVNLIFFLAGTMYWC